MIQIKSVKEIIKMQPLNKQSLMKESSNDAGVVYLSRIPPGMTPHKLTSLLAPFGKIGRVYLAPSQNKSSAKKDKKKQPIFTEAWVEFECKKIAKKTALLLNGEKMERKKGDRFYDDLWNIKYLSHFKWHHLTERINYERAVKKEKLNAELSQAKKENSAFISNVLKSRKLKAIKEKKERKAKEKQQESLNKNVEC